MPKRKSQKTDSSASQEEAVSNKPAILRIVKQNNAVTPNNNPVQSQSLSTALASENHSVEPELQVFDKQSQSNEVSESNNSSVLTSDAMAKTLTSNNEQSDLPQSLETATVNLSELTATEPSISDEYALEEIDLEELQLAKEPAEKKLSTATNSQGQTFTVKEKIQVGTCNFGLQEVFLISLYSAPDGSIWAYYHPVDKNQRLLWKRGCCRIEDLKKLSLAESKQWLTV